MYMQRVILTFMIMVCLITVFMVVMTGCNFEKGAAPLWKADNTRNKTVIISDLHLGISDEYTETLKNRSLLVDFLKKLENTKDVRELVIDGDFLDEWFLPVYYPAYSDQNKFYEDTIANNQEVIDELNKIAEKGIKLVYIPGNHDITQGAEVLQNAIPKIVQVSDVQGLGTYYTGDKNEIAIEHGHRYDVFSAPDTVSNAELCGNDDTIFPAGYFYARYAATWVLEGRPQVKRDLPVITNVPDPTDIDQYGAYLYYSVLKNVTGNITPNEGLEEEIFKMHVSGFDDDYTYLDFYPVEQEDGTISAPVLFRNIQRTWDERQKLNQVKFPTPFNEAVLGTVDWDYYFTQAKKQYLENPEEAVDIVVFGHTHAPGIYTTDSGKKYINSGTWVDHNTVYPDAERTFVVITTGEQNTAVLYSYAEDGSIKDIGTAAAE